MSSLVSFHNSLNFPFSGDFYLLITFSNSLGLDQYRLSFGHDLGPNYLILIDFSLSATAATLIFIFGCGWLFHLLNKGNQVLFIIW